ncbi:glutamate-cysteine ligase family protein [Actinoplanes sp. KI2]|uniref:glutamate-cysteine ligase family protein n=1 Tax=Actinoplanes sp. KI2 TaxID=2983315 RepID=UPI0021D5C985|nr:glutamate-cysteine ligase family protein [Actinoplanes sp. KI2]MCU7727604.1 glutamate-cysteine ligase family protein [Actinoplanes sp. KI2]
MTTLTEHAAEQLIAANAFAPAPPGFVGAAVDVPAPQVRGRHALRHGFLKPGSPRSAIVSGPPSPGLAVCLARMTDDLRAARPLIAPPGDRFSPEAGIRVGLEAGLEGGGILGLARRWRLAHRLAPVLAAAFANAPAAGLRSIRQAGRKNLPVVPPGDPRQAWLAYAMSTPTPAGVSLRDRFRAGDAPTATELADHLDALRPPVAARGHLELDVADAQPGDGWRLPIAVAAALLDDPRAAAQAEIATDHLASEPGLWERAARAALTDPVLAAAARDCFLAAYAALARQGAARSLRDAVADYTERYVLRARTPADDILDHLTARP